MFFGHPSICAEKIYFRNTILAFESFLAIFFSETGHRKKEMQIFIFTFVSPNVERALCEVEINSIFGSLANFLSLPHIRFTLRSLKQYPMSFKTEMAQRKILFSVTRSTIFHLINERGIKKITTLTLIIKMKRNIFSALS